MLKKEPEVSAKYFSYFRVKVAIILGSSLEGLEYLLGYQKHTKTPQKTAMKILLKLMDKEVFI